MADPDMMGELAANCLARSGKHLKTPLRWMKFGGRSTVAKSASTRRATLSSTLRAALERLAGESEVLRYCLQDGDRPTADDYIGLQWWGTPPAEEEMDSLDTEIITLLRAWEAAEHKGSSRHGAKSADGHAD